MLEKYKKFIKEDPRDPLERERQYWEILNKHGIYENQTLMSSIKVVKSSLSKEYLYLKVSWKRWTHHVHILNIDKPTVIARPKYYSRKKANIIYAMSGEIIKSIEYWDF